MDGYNALSGMPHSTRFISQRRALSPRKPTRDTRRDAGGLVEEAFEIYKTARMDGHTPKKAVTTVVNELELKPPTYQCMGGTLRMGGGKP